MNHKPINRKHQKYIYIEYMLFASLFVVILASSYWLLAPSVHAASTDKIKGVSNNGLVGYWSLDEGTSTVAHDFSGNGNNGVIYGSTSWGNGKLGKALSFDGTSYAYIPPSASLNPTSGSITVTVWLKDSGISQSGGCAHMVYDPGVFGITSTCGSVWINEPTSGARMYVYTTGLFDINTWTNVVLTYDKTTGNVIVYKNGSQFISQNVLSPGTSIYPTSSGVYLGGVGLNSQWDGNGKIDEVRVYNRALSAAEVLKLYKQGTTKIGTTDQGANFLSNGLVGYWPFNGKDTYWTSATTGVTYDRSGNGNNGTLTNMNQTTSPIAGKIGQALSFNGTNNFIEVGSSASLNPGSSPLTISVWFKMTADAGLDNAILYNKESLYEASAGGGYFTYAWQPYWAWAGDTSFPVSVGQWYHAVVVYDKSNQYLYKNGKQVYSRSQTGDIGTNSSDLGIGARSVPSAFAFFPGSIDEVRVYNRALSASEVKALYLYGQSVIKH